MVGTVPAALLTMDGLVSKQHIKKLVREGMYRRGVTAADIEAKAIYRTL